MKNNINITPSNNQVLHTKKPKIVIEFLSRDGSNIKKSKIIIYLDNKKIKIKHHDNKYIYKSKRKLRPGLHNVHVSITSESGTTYTKNSCFSVENNEEMHIYFGIPHCHTNYSTGKGSPYDACKIALKNKLDFIFITDHNSDLKKHITYKSQTKNRWYILRKICKKSSIKNKFIALPGYEVKIKGQGHFNVNFIDKLKTDNYKSLSLLEKSVKEENCIISINHPGKSILKLKGFQNYNEMVNLIEVGNGSPPFKYKRYDKIYFYLLDKGWHLAAINGQDNHQMNWGNTENLTGIVCNKLNEASLYDALKKRRVYSTESRTLKLYVKANNQWMGSIINHRESSPIIFDVKGMDTNHKINKTQLVTNNGKIIKEKEFNEKTIHWNFQIESIKNSWYVIRVFLENEKRALSSAIFVE